MNRAELVENIHVGLGKGTKAAAGEYLDAVIRTITGTLASGEQVSLPGLGTFKAVDRPERKGRNPQTGEEIRIPATKVVKFTPSKALREAMKQ